LSGPAQFLAGRWAVTVATGETGPGRRLAGRSAYWTAMTEDTRTKLELDWLKTIAGALAAVSSAVLLSTLGAAGTIIGAALGSVVATVGSALYSQGLARSGERLAQAQTAALRKVRIAQADVRRAGRYQGDDPVVDAHLAHAEERLDEAKEDLGAMADEPAALGWRERLASLPWKRISLLAAGLFAAAVLAITAFELLAGESVSSITGGTDQDGGTTITRIGGDSDDRPSPDDKTPVDDQPSPSDEPSSEPSEQASPTDEPSAEPTDEPTGSPSDSPTPVPTPTTPTTPAPTLPAEPTTTASTG
jgi:hypothetical protein